MSEPEAVQALVQAARVGDVDAMGRLYRRFAQTVHGVLLGYVSRTQADDLTQDVFETAMRRLHELREPAAFPGWLLSIARHAALTSLRSRRVGVSDAPEPVDPGASPEQHADVQHVLAIIRGLPAAYRETLMLRLVEGLSGPEIAARTGLTHGTVRVNLHRGMHLLRAALERDAGEE